MKFQQKKIRITKQCAQCKLSSGQQLEELEERPAVFFLTSENPSLALQGRKHAKVLAGTAHAESTLDAKASQSSCTRLAAFP